MLVFVVHDIGRRKTVGERGSIIDEHNAREPEARANSRINGISKPRRRRFDTGHDDGEALGREDRFHILQEDCILRASKLS